MTSSARADPPRDAAGGGAAVGTTASTSGLPSGAAARRCRLRHPADHREGPAQALLQIGELEEPARAARRRRARSCCSAAGRRAQHRPPTPPSPRGNARRRTRRPRVDPRTSCSCSPAKAARSLSLMPRVDLADVDRGALDSPHRERAEAAGVEHVPLAQVAEEAVLVLQHPQAADPPLRRGRMQRVPMRLGRRSKSASARRPAPRSRRWLTSARATMTSSRRSRPRARSTSASASTAAQSTAGVRETVAARVAEVGLRLQPLHERREIVVVGKVAAARVFTVDRRQPWRKIEHEQYLRLSRKQFAIIRMNAPPAQDSRAGRRPGPPQPPDSITCVVSERIRTCPACSTGRDPG